MRVQSQRIVVHWAGWSSDTYTLQKHGWQLSADQNLYDRSMTLAIRHPDIGLYGISNPISYEYMRNADPMTHKYIDLGMKFRFDQLAHKILFRGYGEPPWKSMYPIDATPQIIHEKVCSLEDLVHFAPIQQPANSVYLEKASINEILEIALNKQEPGQEEIRRRIMHEKQLEKYGKLHTELRLVA